ncbi:uncharacterized protein LOC135082200 isoform X1 [Ostrinia nubilalis]|uniref:uncharacterized protein LOC135082200 isoform X1 n=1 Tax=Ostrinia nubilalis TaxID=29057 RepID=UPI00308235CB
MECGENENDGEKSVDETNAVVNSVILDYYKKFGRKRDLEQYFSLSSAETEVRDVSSLFWRRMKSHTDSSDSGERKSESSTELCRISIKCSMPEPCSSQEDNTKTKSDSESPPIIVEEVASRNTDEDSVNEFNDDNQSQKSIDVTLDTSMNKPHSPTSSITSQRKLEWDSLADVGYGNESGTKTSASSLSTLERLALKQQYSNNDTKNNDDLGAPTAHSTPVDINENKSKSKKGGMRKTTKIYKKDVDVVEVSVPQGSEISPSQPINVNLTKHISFNMERDGGISLDNIKKDLNVTPETAPRTGENSEIKMDKEIQTTLTKTRQQSSPRADQAPQVCYQKVPVLISLNTLKKKFRKKKLKVARRKLRSKKKPTADKENIPQEKSMEQVSAAESFEYMPGHVYNQNQMNQEQPRSNNNATGNKSSLESSGAVTTTESSKDSKHSFTKDLEKSIDLLKVALRKSNDDAELKNKLVKEVVQRLLKSRYRDDESTTDFLSGLSFSSKKLGLGESHTTTSTSDSNNIDINPKSRPRKSILRLDKFNANVLASTSQSAPNLPSVSNSEKPIVPNPLKPTTPTESDVSSGKRSSDTAFAKTSSEELYQKYLEALRREQAYKKHLKDKENFLKQKLVCSDTAFKVPHTDVHVNNKLKDLIKDLTRNNYDDGSGDASKLEGGSNSNYDVQNHSSIRKHRSHSVFTLSSGNSDDNRKANLKKQLQNEMKEAKAGHSRDDHHHQCCCTRQFAFPKAAVDSSVQVNIKNNSNEGSAEKQRQPVQKVADCECCGSNRISPRNVAHVVSDDAGDIKFVCLCNKKAPQQEMPDNMLIYKCSRLTTRGVQLENATSKTSNTVGVQCMGDSLSKPNKPDDASQPSTSKERDNAYEQQYKKFSRSSSSENIPEIDKMSKTSQTNLAIKMLQRKSSVRSFTSSSSAGPKSYNSTDMNKILVHEATRSIQTEISINPRIADPSLTDINIVNDTDCVKLINERFRETSKKNSETDIMHPRNDNDKVDTISNESPRIQHKCVCAEEAKSNHDSPRSCCSNKVDKEIQSDIEPNNIVVQPNVMPHSEATDNFTIPIQGTNMTLMVKIGSQSSKPQNENKCDDFTTQCVGTDKKDTNEKETNLREECSKGVQSQTTDIFSSMTNEMRQSPRDCIFEQPPVEQKKYPTKEEIMDAFNKRCLVNSCLDGNTVRYTYPRNVQINPKQFLRSNTDSGRFVSGTCVQTDSIDKMDAVTQQDPPLEEILKCKTDSEEAKSKSCSDKSCSSKAGSCNEQKGSASESQSRKSSSEGDKDPILDIIKNITKRYSKKDIDRSKKKKCFKEIVTVLNYLLDTDDGTDIEHLKISDTSSARDTDSDKTKKPKEKPACTNICDKKTSPKKVDKAIQLSPKPRANKESAESSEIQATTDFPGTSSDSATCKVLNKIKRECEKYHQKRCKSHMGKKCDPSSSTSVNCDQCKKVHHCYCRAHRCHKSKSSGEKMKKKCVAYNLIIQTSDSMISEETVMDKNSKPLQNIVVKVPSRKRNMEKVPFNEVCSKIEKNMPRCSPRGDSRTHRSRSLPNDSEISSVDEFAKRNCGYTVRDYLEKNRPDFVEKTSNRQQCLKIISEKRADQRATQRQLVSVQLDRRPSVSALSETELRRLAHDLGVQLRRRKLDPKFISEREMKKHSEMIYKSLPEQVQKKEEIKKENIKKTNLLMANMFRKNLQKKTLRGSVNLSNYSTVIKI